MARVKFDPTISVGTLLTVGGGVVGLIVTGITAYNELGGLKEQQRAMAEQQKVVADRQSSITVSLARLESRLDILMERRRAALVGPSMASTDTP